LQSPIEIGDGLLQHRSVRWRARVLEITQGSRSREHQRRAFGTYPDFGIGHRWRLRSAFLGSVLLRLDSLTFPASCHMATSYRQPATG
jgi:hypothetical protein